MHSGRRVLSVAAIVSVAALALAGSVAAAETSGPTAQRQALMKSFGMALRDTAPMANGQAEIDKAKVKTAMDTVAKGAKSAKKLFPPESAADAGSAADTKIWQDKADFMKRLDDMSKHAQTVQKAKDATELKASFTTLSADCKSCHDVYRRKKG